MTRLGTPRSSKEAIERGGEGLAVFCVEGLLERRALPA